MSFKRHNNEKFKARHLEQKYNLIHLLPSIGVPELSGLYLKSFFNASKRYDLQLPPLVLEGDSKFCGCCGCVRVPNFNTKMRIEEVPGDEIGESKRTLVYSCMNCNHQASFLLSRSSNKVNTDKKETSAFVATWPSGKDSDGKVEKRNNAKDRAKKRKSSTLSSLLSKKTENQEKTTLSSLNLESFMERD